MNSLGIEPMTLAVLVLCCAVLLELGHIKAHIKQIRTGRDQPEHIHGIKLNVNMFVFGFRPVAGRLHQSGAGEVSAGHHQLHALIQRGQREEHA